MPLYFNLDRDDPTFSNDILLGLKQIELDTREIAITPRIALAQIRQQLIPLLPREHSTVIDNLSAPTWDDVLCVFAELVSRSEGADRRLIEVAQAIRLIHTHSIRQPRELAFPEFVEVMYFLQMHDHQGAAVRHLCNPDEIDNCAIFRFCKYCWRLAVPAKRLCLVHQPSTEEIKMSMERGGTGQKRDALYKEASRQKKKFDEAVQKIVTKEALEFHETSFKADVLFPASGIHHWLLKRRPALCRTLGKVLDLSSDETVVNLLLEFLHSSNGMPIKVATAYQKANSMIQTHPQLIWPMLVRAEAWYMAREHLTKNWGGRRDGAGRK